MTDEPTHYAVLHNTDPWTLRPIASGTRDECFNALTHAVAGMEPRRLFWPARPDTAPAPRPEILVTETGVQALINDALSDHPTTACTDPLAYALRQLVHRLIDRHVREETSRCMRIVLPESDAATGDAVAALARVATAIATAEEKPLTADTLSKRQQDALFRARPLKYPTAVGPALKPGLAVIKTSRVPDGEAWATNGYLFIGVREPSTGDLSNPRALAAEADFRGREAAYAVRKAFADSGVLSWLRLPLGPSPTRSKGEDIYRRLVRTYTF